MKMSSSSTSDTIPSLCPVTKPVSLPEVVRFAYKEFTVNSTTNKWKAKCSTCNEVITETRGTTTGFARYTLAFFSRFKHSV